MKKIKLTPIVSALGIIASAVVRFFVITQHTEISNNPLKRSTGFLFHGDELLWNGLYYGIIIIAAIAAIIAAVVDSKGEAEELKGSGLGKGRTILIGLLMMAAAVFAAYDGRAEMSAFSPTAFLIIIDFAFAVLMAVISFVTLSNKRFTPVIGYLYSLVGAFCICRGIYCFMSRMAIATVPEYVIQSLSLVTMAVYFVMLARFLSGNSGKHTRKAMGFWGVSAVSLTFSSALGAIAAKFFGADDIKPCIVFSANDAENYRQARAGADAYNLVVTPTVELALALIVLVTLIIAFTKPSSSIDN
ncbi:MAG: hypothetical protein K2J77_09775 [Oscillospiraceae bacterium]|nr:hypothetical protein [Oscillospiraceae bacterium]